MISNSVLPAAGVLLLMINNTLLKKNDGKLSLLNEIVNAFAISLIFSPLVLQNSDLSLYSFSPLAVVFLGVFLAKAFLHLSYERRRDEWVRKNTAIK